MADPVVAQEIERAVTRALSKSGQGGSVVVKGDFCEFHTDAPVVAIDIGEWVTQWNLLPDEMKEARATRAATRLTNALNESQGRSAPVPKAELVRRARRVALVVGTLFALGLIGIWLSRQGFFGGDGSGAESTAAVDAGGNEPSQEDAAGRAARIARVCDAARQRIYQGGSMGMDIEGWVVELWLARPGVAAGGSATPLIDDEALDALVASGAVQELGAKGPSEITLHAADSELGLSTAVVRFSEGYVAPFFKSQGRTRFVAVAEKVADAVGATHAGMYARCAHLPTARDVGAWYRGADLNAALVSTLFAAGRYANPPAFNAQKYREQGLLAKLDQAIATLDDAERDDILRKQGGKPHPRLTGGKTTSVSLRFPLGGPTRPTLTSREIAASLDL